MPTVVRRFEVSQRIRSFHPVVEVLLVWGLVGLLVSIGIATYGVDLAPGFF